MSGISYLPHRPRRWALALTGLLTAVVVTPGVTASGTAIADEPTAQAVHSAQWALTSLEVQRAWARTQGQGITVAVLDSGVDASHPDLRGRVTAGGDFGDGASGDGTHDAAAPEGHGTEVASLIAGTGRNYDRNGLLGVAPGARILSFGVYRNGQADSSAVAKAVRAAVSDGAQVIVVPSVSGPTSPAVAAAVRRAMARDVVVVSGVAEPVSTAGVTRTVRPPSVPGIVTVAAVDRQGRLWPRSGYGGHVALAAPGVDILAASSDNRYWTGNDTAFAASWVAGAAALLRAGYPGWTAAQTIQKLLDTARRTACGQGCGYGLVNPFRAVTDAARPTATVNPLLGAPVPHVVTPTASTDLASQRLLLFGMSALAALALYVAVTAVFIHRQRDARQE